MIYILIGFLFFVAGFGLLRWASHAPPSEVARLLYRLAGVALSLFAAFLFMRKQWVLAMPVAIMAWSMFRRVPASAGADKSERRGSTVRTAALEMTLDHDTGMIIGRVLAGRFEGCDLDGLSEPDLMELLHEVRADRESGDLLEAYLDGRCPDWRDDFEADDTAREGGTTNTGPMTEEEAYQILGLAADATEADIVAAHRRLMKRVHPDQGGSTFLATKINAAKAVLLRKHG